MNLSDILSMNAAKLAALDKAVIVDAILSEQSFTTTTIETDKYGNRTKQTDITVDGHGVEIDSQEVSWTYHGNGKDGRVHKIKVKRGKKLKEITHGQDGKIESVEDYEEKLKDGRATRS